MSKPRAPIHLTGAEVLPRVTNPVASEYDTVRQLNLDAGSRLPLHAVPSAREHGAYTRITRVENETTDDE